MNEIYLGADIPETAWMDADARRFLSPIIAEGSRAFVKNADCQPGIAIADGILLPFTVTEFLPDNSYICSPFNHYVTYAQEELRNLGNRPLEIVLAWVLRGLGQLLNPRAFDKVVMVNNWLLSTNLYPQMDGTTATSMLQMLVEHFPDHAIAFRSLDRFRNPHLVEALMAHGCDTVFTRKIWYQDARSEQVQKSIDFKNDLRLLRRTPYQIIPITNETDDSTIERLVYLYNQLYLEKYSYHNPQFTSRWVRLMLQENLMHFTALVQDGRIDGVFGYVERNGVMAQPFLGYDTALPQKTGLYRLLSVLILQEAERKNYLCHASSGVGRFKKLRGGIGTEEYNLVYTRHLPPSRQRAWKLIQTVLDTIAVPMIQKGGY
jgi:hypothetical protein